VGGILLGVVYTHQGLYDHHALAYNDHTSKSSFKLLPCMSCLCIMFLGLVVSDLPAVGPGQHPAAMMLLWVANLSSHRSAVLVEMPLASGR
jgi:hypothetical protein